MPLPARRCSLLAALALAAPLAAAAPEPPVPPEWRTKAEASDFAATASYDETIEFLRRLERQAPRLLKLSFFGTSGAGRPLPLVIVSGHDTFSAKRARESGRPIVLVQSGIHAGEIDGKEASLMLLRDLALGRRRELLAAGTLLFMPIYNPDGHERVSPYNRPNQDGPRQGMGFRTTAAGLDLNRDHVKLASEEARALVALFNAWRPHLHVDNHVTDGADFAWVFTYGVAQAPRLAPPLDAWMRAHLPTAVAATQAAGWPSGPYVAFIDEEDPMKGLEGGAGPPRFSTSYFPLRNRPSILVEMHSYKPYRDRVLANRDFLAALLAEVAKDPHGLVRAAEEAEARTVALGRPDAPPSEIALDYAPGPASGQVRVPLYEWRTEPSVVTGQPLLRYRRGAVRETELPMPGEVVSVARPRPRGYLVLPGWPQIESRLRWHGLRVERLQEPAELEVETLRVAEPTFAPRPYQGLTAVTEVAVAVARERRTAPAGALWVPADQPDFELAAHLLEPEAPDSLLAWGLLSSVFERKEYIEGRVLEEIAAGMLRDPKVKAEWEAALRDEAFARDPQARHLWWYRRTPYWDETVGLLPYYRVGAPPKLVTRPWH